MTPWIESIGVILLAASGAAIAWKVSPLAGVWWTSGYAAGLLLVCLIGLARRFPVLEFLPPFSWVLAGRMEFSLGGFIAALLLVTPLSRLPRRRDRAALIALLIVFVSLTSVWPFLAPAFNHRLLSSLRSEFDAEGICRQSTDYDCGPAAAVTGLRCLGLSAEEGEIAVLAHTSPAIGTPPDLLADALQRRFGPDGLESEYRHFQHVSELNRDGITLAVIKFGFLVDHYVTVLAVTNGRILVGDPVRGRQVYRPVDFEKAWRHTGVVLRRPPKPASKEAK